MTGIDSKECNDFVNALNWMYCDCDSEKIIKKSKKEILKEVKYKIKRILTYYDCDIRIIDQHSIGLVNQDFVVNQVIENLEIL
jgi:hypothetical protein